jgi:hypothetical protein
LEKELEAFGNFGITPKKYTCIQTKILLWILI